LINKTYKTSAYSTFIIHEPKEREIFRLPYYPDRIVHHAVMIHLEQLFVSTFTKDTYSCIKKRGIHAAATAVKETLAVLPEKAYCLKLDIKKFYPSVDHRILKQLLRRKIKDEDLLWLLYNIIDSAPGLPIGNYLSQYFANFYLSYFDHWVKEELKALHYFRYADDIVLFSGSKEQLHGYLAAITQYLQENLSLTVKSNYQVFLIADHPKAPGRGLDFLGYVFYRFVTRLRKSIKQNYARKVAKVISVASAASYWGWAKWANCNHLLKTLHKKTA
jgi:RNA-directed DNA polymerase